MATAGGTTSNQIRPPWALGECDRCGFPYRLNELHREFYDQRPNGLLVCKACLDKDHPQLLLGKIKVYDPQSLINPRPDVARLNSVGLFGWMPVGSPLNNIQCSVGTVTVVVV